MPKPSGSISRIARKREGKRVITRVQANRERGQQRRDMRAHPRWASAGEGARGGPLQPRVILSRTMRRIRRTGWFCRKLWSSTCSCGSGAMKMRNTLLGGRFPVKAGLRHWMPVRHGVHVQLAHDPHRYSPLPCLPSPPFPLLLPSPPPSPPHPHPLPLLPSPARSHAAWSKPSTMMMEFAFIRMRRPLPGADGSPV